MCCTQSILVLCLCEIFISALDNVSMGVVGSLQHFIEGKVGLLVLVWKRSIDCRPSGAVRGFIEV